MGHEVFSTTRFFPQSLLTSLGFPFRLSIRVLFRVRNFRITLEVRNGDWDSFWQLCRNGVKLFQINLVFEFNPRFPMLSKGGTQAFGGAFSVWGAKHFWPARNNGIGKFGSLNPA